MFLCIIMYVIFVFAPEMPIPIASIFGNTFLLVGSIVAPTVPPFTLLIVRHDHHRRMGIFTVTQLTLSDQGIDARVNNELVSVSW